MPDDRERILNRLQATLRHEVLAATCYELHAVRARNLQRNDISARLAAVAETHRHHIADLEQRIQELGGTPAQTQAPASLLENTCGPMNGLLHALEHDLRAEDTEIEEYEQLSRQADGETAELCEAHIKDDRDHLAWLREQVVRERNLDDIE